MRYKATEQYYLQSFSHFDTEHRLVTDRQTDKLTPGCSIYRAEGSSCTEDYRLHM